MIFSGGLRGRDERHAHFLGALQQLAQDPLVVALLVVVLALIGVFLALGHWTRLTIAKGVFFVVQSIPFFRSTGLSLWSLFALPVVAPRSARFSM